MCVLFCEFCIHSKRVQQKWNFWQVIPILMFGSHIFPKAEDDLKQNGTQLQLQFWYISSRPFYMMQFTLLPLFQDMFEKLK